MTSVKQLQHTTGFKRGSLERPLYSPGLLLEDEDLNSGVAYTRRLTQMLFNALFGCGVICGLRVKGTPGCNGQRLEVTVERGLALDCMGNPIEVPTAQTLTYDLDCKDPPEAVWVVACYVEKACGPREVSCGHDESSGREMTRTRQGFEIKLYGERPDDACGCKKTRLETPDPDGRCCPPSGTNADIRPSSTADAAAGATNSETVEEDCYKDHVDGVCSCCCGCDCVIIGRLVVENRENFGTAVITAAYPDPYVRYIKPVLLGQGFQEARSASEQAPPPAAGTT